MTSRSEQSRRATGASPSCPGWRLSSAGVAVNLAITYLILLASLRFVGVSAADLRRARRSPTTRTPPALESPGRESLLWRSVPPRRGRSRWSGPVDSMPLHPVLARPSVSPHATAPRVLPEPAHTL